VSLIQAYLIGLNQFKSELIRSCNCVRLTFKPNFTSDVSDAGNNGTFLIRLSFKNYAAFPFPISQMGGHTVEDISFLLKERGAQHGVSQFSNLKGIVA